jgi:L-threonine kinase
MTGTVSAAAPATCGELIQGCIDGRDFLVTSPIDVYSTASVKLLFDAAIDVHGTAGASGAHTKAAAAVRATLAHLGLSEIGATVDIESVIPRSKGMASSSADINAAIHATAEAVGRAMTSSDMCRIAVSIEPSDGVFYQGVVMLDQIHGHLIDLLGAPPPLAFLVVDTGGEVQTLKFDRERARAHARQNEPRILEAIQLLRRGFAQGDGRPIAQAATLSARLNQSVLHKAPLEDLLAATLEAGALGINCAHTGTVLGILFDPRSHHADAIRRRVEDVVGAPQILGVHRLISGGSRIVRGSSDHLTAAQLELIERHGQPVNRIDHDGQFVLEFASCSGSGDSVRRFGYADGELKREHPTASEGQFATPSQRRPLVGECWDMRVEIARIDQPLVTYRRLAPVDDIQSAVRALPRGDFDDAFCGDGDSRVLRVRIVSVSGNLVTYARSSDGLGLPGPGARKSLPLPIFLSNFRLAPAAMQPPSGLLAGFVAQHGIRAELVFPGAEMPTVPLAASALGVASARIVKSVVLRENKKKSAAFGIAIVPGDRFVDPAKVGSALGLERLRLAPLEQVEKIVGFQVGGVPPVGHLTRLRVVVDATVGHHDIVFGGGGDAWHMLKISPAEIIRATDAVVADAVVDPTT